MTDTRPIPLPRPAAPTAAHPVAGAPTDGLVVHRAVEAQTDGERLDADGPHAALVRESAARAVVRLTGDQYAEFVLRAPADALTVRYSLPDAPGGGGLTADLAVQLDGGPLRRLALTSRHCWYYGAYPFSNDPAAGRARHFYDDAHLLLGRTCPPGTRIRLRPVGTDLPVVLDTATFELAGGPTPAPEDALSALDHGADPTGGADSTAALQAALDAASAANRPLWLPPGSYTVTGHLLLDRVTVRGAGPWHTALRGAGAGLYGRPAPDPSTNVRVSGLALFGDVTERDDGAQLNGFGGALGGGSVIEDVWVSHTKCGIWLDGPFEGLTIRNVRIMNTTGDGINLHRGVSHTTVTGCRIHNTGDDGIALWSDVEPDHHVTIDANTVTLPLLGNHIAVYGGHDHRVTRNLLTDSVAEGGGIHLANRYGATPLAGEILVEDNHLLRTGSRHPGHPDGTGALWLAADDAPLTARITVRGNRLTDSPHAAVRLSGSRIDGLDVDGMTIDGAGSCALQLQAAGSARFAGVRAARLGITGIHRPAPGFRLHRGPGNAGWDQERPALPPDGALHASAVRLDFPATDPGATAEPRRLHLANPGPRPARIHAAATTGDFTAALPGGCPLDLPPGASVPVTVEFAPTGTGRRTGVLTVHTDAPSGPVSVDLAGVGFDPTGDRALGRAVRASTSMGGFPPEATVDGVPTTWWQSDGQGFPQWLQVDLGELVHVTRLVLRTPTSWEPRTETVAVHLGGTDADLRQVLPATDCRFTPDHGNRVEVPLDRTTRLVRLVVTSNSAWTGAALSGFEVYADRPQARASAPRKT